MNKRTLITGAVVIVIIAGVIFWLARQPKDARLIAAQEAAQHLQERLEVISQINDHKYAIEQLKVREAELQTLENEAKVRSIENASGYNYLETSF